jgi:hypothetical protein
MAFDLALKAAKSAGFQIQAAKISGNLLSGVKLIDAQVGSAFVNGKVKVARVKYPLWQLLTKRDLRLDVALEGAVVDFDPLKLPPVDPNVAAPPVNVFLERVSLQDVRLKLRGKFVEIPNVTAQVLEQQDTSEQNLSGILKLALETVTGSGTAIVNYSISKDWVFNLIADANLDARIARYWYKDIISGRVIAHYNLLGDKLSGFGEVKDGVLEPIPGIVVSNVNGSIIHDTKGFISGILKGTALDGPLKLDIGVDTVFKKENISFTGWAEPKLQPALRAFKADLPASGKVRVTVSGGGWEKLEFKGKIAGAGRVLEFPLEKIRGDWVFNSPGDTLRANVLANSRFLEADVNAKANLNFSLLENLAVVNASVVGEKVLGAPLEATGQLTANGENLVYALESKILNGQVKANGDLKSGKSILGSGVFKEIRAPIPLENRLSGEFSLGGINSDIRIAGKTTASYIKIPAVKSSSFPGMFVLRVRDGLFSGTAQLGEFSWNGNLKNGVLGIKNLQLEPAGVVNANANYILQGSNISLAGKLGTSKLELQGAKLENANGPFTLEVGNRVNGYWNADQLEAFVRDNRLRVKPRNWLVSYSGQRARLIGDATYLFNGNLEGQLLAKTEYGLIRAVGQGKTIELDGNLKYSPLAGKTISALATGTLQLEPFTLQTTANISSYPNVLSGKVYANLGSSLQAGGEILTAGGRKLNLKFENGVLNSSGEVNLSAVDAVLPKSAQGQISGVAKLEFVNTNGTGKLSAKAFGIPILADVTVKNNQVSTNAIIQGSLLKGATATGQVFSKINALLTYGSIRARVTGKTDNLKFNAFGTLPSKPQLEQLGLGTEIKKLGLDWNPEVIAIKGSFKQNTITASGNIGKLEIKSGQYNLTTQAIQANWRGSFSARYQNKPIELTNSTGQVNSSRTGIKFNVVADKLYGEFQNQRANALGIRAKASIIEQGTTFEITARRVDAKLQGQVLNAQNLDARGSIVANGKINLDVNADQLDANLQGQKVKASNLSARAVISSVTKFDINLKATSLDAAVQGQQIKASSITAVANSNGQLQGKLEAQSLVGNLVGTAFALQGIHASAVPINGKLEVDAKVKLGTMNVQNNPVNVRNLKANGIVGTTNIAELASANFKASFKATSTDGKLEGIGAKTQNLNASVARIGSSLMASITAGAASANGKDWQIETSNLTANNLKYNLEKPTNFGAEARISSATGSYQKNPFKLENTLVSLDSSGNGLGFRLNSVALEGRFEAYQIRTSQVLASGKLEPDLLVFDAQSGHAKVLKNTDQLEAQNLELNGRYDLKRGNASVSNFKLATVSGNLGTDTLSAQALEGNVNLINATSGKLQDALLRGRVAGKNANGTFEGQDFKLEDFKANLEKSAQKYQAQLEATRAMGGWQDISANLEQFKLAASLEDQRLTGNVSGLRASGIYQDANATFEKFKLNGELNGAKISGQLFASRGSGNFQNGTANLANLNLQATSEDGLIQTHLEVASGSGKFQNASANLEPFKLNAKLKNDNITADLEGTRATGAFQEAKAKFEQFKLIVKRVDQIWSGDLEAMKGTGSYLDGRGNLLQLKLNARLNGKVVTGALKAQHFDGNWKDISANLEQLQLMGELNENNFNGDLTAANGLGKTKDANANLEQLKLGAQLIKHQIFGTLEAIRGNGTFQKAKAELNNFKVKGSLVEKLVNLNLEAQNGTGSYQDASAKLEQFNLDAQVIDGLVTGDLTGTRGSGAYKDGTANFEQFNLNAQLDGNKLRGKLEALTANGVWSKNDRHAGSTHWHWNLARSETRVSGFQCLWQARW